MHAVLEKGSTTILKYRSRFIKDIRQWVKERFNLLREKEETSMVLGKEWLLPMAEKFLPADAPKEEKNCLCHLNQDIKNND